ncbi:integral membrane protein [Coniochaeta sp. 2T2.1]|nr:integral membrane protein [Coniochaeta sp. 2T2.1]
MQIPASSVLASWPTPNYIDPVTHGPANIIVIVLLLSLAVIFLCIRFYTRLLITRGSGVDDILILLAFIPAAAFAILGIIATARLNWDRHSWDVRPELVKPGLQFGLATQILFDIATTLTKLSMLALIQRIAAAGASRMRFVVSITGFLIGLNGLLFVFITMLQCSPVSAYWTISFTPQKCINEKAHVVAAGTINTVTDFFIVLLPIKLVMELNLPKKQRVAVYVLFTGGILVGIAGAVRTYFTWLLTSSPNHDITWNSYYVMLVSSVELFLGIICASIPATKPFFGRYIPRLIGATTSSGRDVTEPLAAARKKASQESFWTFRHSRGDVESQSQVQVAETQHPEFKPGHKRKLTPADLNKPLPPVVMNVPFKIAVDRTFSWDKLRSPRAGGSVGGSTVASGHVAFL